MTNIRLHVLITIGLPKVVDGADGFILGNVVKWKLHLL